MAKDVDILTRFATANEEAVGYIDRVDVATSKFRKGPRKGSIVKAAQGNLFEFPVFISNTIPLDYATATTSLLEQIYATYLQMAMSINPVVDSSSVKRGVQFANYKTNTNKYLEYTDTTYQHDVCHAEYINEEVKMEFDLLSIDDKEAQLINEAYDYQPLSEFSHFFQEADTRDIAQNLYPVPMFTQQGTVVVNFDKDKHPYNVIDSTSVAYMTIPEMMTKLTQPPYNATPDGLKAAINNMDNTMKFYHLKETSTFESKKHSASNNTDKADMDRIQSLCGMLTPKEFYGDSRHAPIQAMIDDLDKRNPGFKASMNKLMQNVDVTKQAAEKVEQRLNAEEGRRDAQASLWAQQEKTSAAQEDNFKAGTDLANAQKKKLDADTGDIENRPSYQDFQGALRQKAVDDISPVGKDGEYTYTRLLEDQRRTAEAQRILAERQAAVAQSNYYKAMEAITKGGQAAQAVAGAINTGAQAIGNIATLPANIRTKKAESEIKQYQAAHLDEENARKWTDIYSRTKTSNIGYVDDAKCAKMNTMKPLLMKVTLNMLNKDDSLQPIEYVVGVKCHTRMVQASILPEVAKYPLKEMDKISRKVKWRAGELKFFKDLVFRIKEKKQTAADSRDPNRKWYRRLYELAHMKGDAPAAAVVEGKSLFKVFIKDKQGKGNLLNGMIPNASIIMSQADVDNIKAQTEIDLLKPSAAKKFCGELFLMSLVIIDIERESIKILLPDMNSDYDVHSLAAVNKQLATLDTMGTKTRDMFKLLGK